MKENYLETVKEIYALLMKRERLSSIMLAEELLAKLSINGVQKQKIAALSRDSLS